LRVDRHNGPRLELRLSKILGVATKNFESEQLFPGYTEIYPLTRDIVLDRVSHTRGLTNAFR
jgi:hypothetical protein